MLRGFDDGVDYARIECAKRGVMEFCFGDGLGERFRGAVHFISARLECFGDAGEDAAKAGAAHRVVGRKIGAAEKRLAFRGEESGERPATLSRNGADGGL